MIYIIHGFILCILVVMLLIYLGKYAEVMNTVRGMIVDLTYMRIYIIGIVITVAIMMLVMTPLIGISAGVQPIVTGEVVITSMICLFFGLQAVVALERQGTEIEQERGDVESHDHHNKEYVRDKKVTLYLTILLTAVTPFIGFAVNVTNQTWFYISLIIYVLSLFVMYITTKMTLDKISSDEQEVREQIQKNLGLKADKVETDVEA